jgi:DNA-directed RNA polymerase specialized sigma subunit
MCNLTVFDGFIAAMAERASRLNRGGYNDFEDYMQIGRLAAWQASKKWSGRGSFPCYARMAIRYEIINAAIDSGFVVSAPRKVKRTANLVTAMLNSGCTDEQISQSLGLDPKELNHIRCMIAPVCREGGWA